MFGYAVQADTLANYSTWRLSADQLVFDSNKTLTACVEDSSVGLRLAIDIKRGAMVGGFGMYIGSLDDSNSFTQAIEDQHGKTSEANSAVSALSFFGELGASYQVHNSAYAELVAGYQTMSVDRSISNCESQDIPLDGGLYLKPRVKIALGEKYILSASYLSYFSDDITSGLVIGFEGRF